MNYNEIPEGILRDSWRWRIFECVYVILLIIWFLFCLMRGIGYTVQGTADAAFCLVMYSIVITSIVSVATPTSWLRKFYSAAADWLEEHEKRKNDE